MDSKDTQDLKQKVSAQMSQLDSQVRATLTDLKQSGNSTYADLKQKSNATVSDFQKRGSTAINPYVDRVKTNVQALWGRYLTFSQRSPVVSAFLTIQVLLAGVPLLVFSGFMLFVISTVAFFASCIIGTFFFFAACILVPVLLVTSFVAASIFTFLGSCVLGLQLFNRIRRYGVREGTRVFLFGVERELKNDVGHAKVAAMRAEDRVSDYTGQSKLEDFVPGVGSAA